MQNRLLVSGVGAGGTQAWHRPWNFDHISTVYGEMLKSSSISTQSLAHRLATPTKAWTAYTKSWNQRSQKEGQKHRQAGRTDTIVRTGVVDDPVHVVSAAENVVIVTLNPLDAVPEHTPVRCSTITPDVSSVNEVKHCAPPAEFLGLIWAGWHWVSAGVLNHNGIDESRKLIKMIDSLR